MSMKQVLVLKAEDFYKTTWYSLALSIAPGLLLNGKISALCFFQYAIKRGLSTVHSSKFSKGSGCAHTVRFQGYLSDIDT